MLANRRSFNWLDAFLLILLVGALGFVVYRITMHLHYSWNWRVIPQFLVRYDQEEGRWVANYLLQGLLTTLRLSLWSGVLALLLGLLVALARTSGSLYWRLVARTFIELMRNLPPLVIIFLFYFFLADQFLSFLEIDQFVASAPSYWQHLFSLLLAPPGQLSAFLSALITLALFEGAYVAEIFRAGIESVNRSQWEAAAALGLTRGQSLRHIVLPQAVRRVLPPLAGQLISLIKDSSIVSVISIQELTYQGTQLMASTYLTIEVWLTIAALYFFLTFPCSLAVEQMERRLNPVRK